MRFLFEEPLMKTALALLFVGASLVGAAPENTTHIAGRAVKTPGPPGYLEVKDKDKAMDAAVDHAHQTLGFFCAALKAKKPDTRGYEIKTAFTDGEQVEHIWVNKVTWDGHAFHGQVNNKPLAVGNVHLGQKVTLQPKQVSDWMFVKEGKLIGGFTTRVLYARLSAEDKAQFESQAEFKIE
jgi:uncharacterized protein YegJ (DUF2314 family)